MVPSTERYNRSAGAAAFGDWGSTAGGTQVGADPRRARPTSTVVRSTVEALSSIPRSSRNNVGTAAKADSLPNCACHARNFRVASRPGSRPKAASVGEKPARQERQ